MFRDGHRTLLYDGEALFNRHFRLIEEGAQLVSLLPDSQTRARLEAFETGEAPFGEEATEAYGEDVSGIEAVVSAVVPDDAA